MTVFQHFLITRFNVKSTLGFDDIVVDPKQTIYNNQWLEERFRLFEQFCYPSVKGQSNQQFKWLVFFDINTPDELKKRINVYSEWKGFIPVFVAEFDLNILKETLKNNFDDCPDYLITSRLDNDDAISKDYIQIIQNNFKQQKFEFINLHWGYVLHECSGKIYLKGEGCNPYISLIESSKDFQTVYLKRHSLLYDLYQPNGLLKTIGMRSQPTWLQVIHNNNVYNYVKGIRQSNKQLTDRFALNAPEIITKEDNLILVWLEQRIRYLNLKVLKPLRTKLGLRTRFQKLLRQAEK